MSCERCAPPPQWPQTTKVWQSHPYGWWVSMPQCLQYEISSIVRQLVQCLCTKRPVCAPNRGTIFFWLERATWKDKCTHTYKLKQKTNKQPLTNKHTAIHTQTHTYKFVCARILGCQIRVQIQEHTHGSTMCSQVRFAPGSQETVDKIMICAEVRGQCEPLYCENGCLVCVCV